jgi:hypothetical protein
MAFNESPSADPFKQNPPPKDDKSTVREHTVGEAGYVTSADDNSKAVDLDAVVNKHGKGEAFTTTAGTSRGG